MAFPSASLPCPIQKRTQLNAKAEKKKREEKKKRNLSMRSIRTTSRKPPTPSIP
jgi:hypothetical protein